MIDIAQKNGTAGSFNIPKSVTKHYAAPFPGYANGGFVIDSPAKATNQTKTNDYLASLLTRLDSTLKENSQASEKLAQKEFEINANEIFFKRQRYEEAVRASEY